MKIVVDTSLLIDFTRKKKNKKEEIMWPNLVEYSKKGGHQLVVPSAVVFEFFSGDEMDNQTNFNKAEEVFKDTVVFDLNEEVAKKAAELFRKNELNIGTVDYFVASTALIYEGELATLNSKHFRNFDDLKLFDFKKLDKV